MPIDNSLDVQLNVWGYREGGKGYRGRRFAQAVEEAGATIINTGIGWHEARVPAIATFGASLLMSELFAL